MASTAQVEAFNSKYAKSASQDAAILNLPPQVILGQWNMETGSGTQNFVLPSGKAVNAEAINNLGNIMQNVGTTSNPKYVPVQFASMNQFNQAYIQAMQTDFPNYDHNASQQWDPNQTNQQNLQRLFNGKQSYDPSSTNYGDLIYGGMQGIAATPQGTPTTGLQPNTPNPNPSLSSTTNPYSGLAGVIESLWQYENNTTSSVASKLTGINFGGKGFHRFLIVLVGIGIIWIGLLVFGISHAKQIVPIAASMA